jgi:hypothetical protein
MVGRLETLRLGRMHLRTTFCTIKEATQVYRFLCTRENKWSPRRTASRSTRTAECKRRIASGTLQLPDTIGRCQHFLSKMDFDSRRFTNASFSS